MSARGHSLRPVKIVAIGDELLEGRTADTNSRRIERALGGHGVRVTLGQIVPDDLDAIIEALDRTEAGDLVFVTGGLGSTPDDMTRDAVAIWGEVPLVEDPRLRERLVERWRRRGIKTTRGVGPQCQVPRGLAPVTNPVGSAPGLVGLLRDRMLAVLPGVPAELEGLLPGTIARLEEMRLLPAPFPARVWRTAQTAELKLVHMMEGVTARHDDLRWSWWLTDWGCDVRVADPAGDETRLAGVAAEVDAVLGYRVTSRSGESLPETVMRRMVDRGTTLATAESCTAGLIGGALTEPSGSSAFFRGGIMAYADAIKRDLLGVPAGILHEHGAVSEPVALAMARGCRASLGTDYGLAVSGISGPTGGTDEKPVGTTWMAVATPEGAFAHCYRFPGDRERNRLLTVAAAVDTVRRALEFGDDRSPWRPEDDWCRPR